MDQRTSLARSPIPGVTVRVEGDVAAIRHFAAEWADAPLDGAADGTAQPAPQRGSLRAARLSVAFVPELAGAAVQRHKSVRWSSRLEWSADAGDLRLRIALHGRPRWFGLSLVQGYLVEPALSLLAPDTAAVLLPAAAVVRDGAATILLGRSGTGKSSLSLRAVTGGLPVLGDDQIVVTATGECRRFPRRLRLYSDARRTAPAAFARLPARDRRGLRLRGILKTASGGFVAPSLAVPISALGAPPPSAAYRVDTVVLLERGADAPGVSVAASDGAVAVRRSAEILAAQRARLAATLDGSWDARLAEVAGREDAILAGAFAGATVLTARVPDGGSDRGAERVLGELAAALGLP